jgi:hypothetical protein
MNLLLTGIPLGLFILFSITVFIVALVVALIVALLGAVLFTVFCVGVALCIVLPTILFTTFAAVFLFLWGLGGYYLLRWANGDSKEGENGEASEGNAIGDKLNSLTGGRLTGFMEDARGQNAKKSIEGYSDRFTKPAGEKDNDSTATTTGSNAKSGADQHVGSVTTNAQNAASGGSANLGGAVNTTQSGLGSVSGLKLG